MKNGPEWSNFLEEVSDIFTNLFLIKSKKIIAVFAEKNCLGSLTLHVNANEKRCKFWLIASSVPLHSSWVSKYYVDFPPEAKQRDMDLLSRVFQLGESVQLLQ